VTTGVLAASAESPTTLADRTIVLQHRVGGVWRQVAVATIKQDGGYAVSWTPPSGSPVVRAHFAGGSGLAPGSSSSLTLTVATNGQSTPENESMSRGGGE
jgi:hypothetical protein